MSSLLGLSVPPHHIVPDNTPKSPRTPVEYLPSSVDPCEVLKEPRGVPTEPRGVPAATRRYLSIPVAPAESENLLHGFHIHLHAFF